MNCIDFKYQEATMQNLETRWDINIANNPNDERWVAWKTQFIEDNKNNKCKTFVVLHGDEPIGEGTLIFSHQYVEINALRIEKRYEGQRHISKLVKIMEQFAKNAGYKEILIGVEAKETRNLGIYLHWGYDRFVKSETEDGELVLYYSKGVEL